MFTLLIYSKSYLSTITKCSLDLSKLFQDKPEDFMLTICKYFKPRLIYIDLLCSLNLSLRGLFHLIELSSSLKSSMYQGLEYLFGLIKMITSVSCGLRCFYVTKGVICYKHSLSFSSVQNLFLQSLPHLLPPNFCAFNALVLFSYLLLK